VVFGGPEGDAQALGGGVQLDLHAVIVSHLGDTGTASKSEAGPCSGEDAVNVLWSLQTSYSVGRGDVSIFGQGTRVLVRLNDMDFHPVVQAV
jgi:hypothetical protein